MVAPMLTHCSSRVPGGLSSVTLIRPRTYGEPVPVGGDEPTPVGDDELVPVGDDELVPLDDELVPVGGDELIFT
jgi:hypothetical protein